MNARYGSRGIRARSGCSASSQRSNGVVSASHRPSSRRSAGTFIQPVFGNTKSEEHTSELQSLMRISYAVFCLKKKTTSAKDSNRTPQKQVIYRHNRNDTT